MEHRIRDIKRKQKMIQLRISGMNLRQIGEIYDISKERVRQIIGIVGWTKKPKHKRMTENEKEEKRKKAFWSKVNKKSDNECWEWLGVKLPYGYGKISTSYNSGGYAHRYMYSIIYGEIPNDLCVLHKCDNPSCVNPNHLFLGTNLDNIKDRDKKGRTNHKINQEQQKDIIHRYNLGERKSELSKVYNVSYSCIRRIIKIHWNEM